MFSLFFLGVGIVLVIAFGCATEEQTLWLPPANMTSERIAQDQRDCEKERQDGWAQQDFTAGRIAYRKCMQERGYHIAQEGK